MSFVSCDFLICRYAGRQAISSDKCISTSKLLLQQKMRIGIRDNDDAWAAMIMWKVSTGVGNWILWAHQDKIIAINSLDWFWLSSAPCRIYNSPETILMRKFLIVSLMPQGGNVRMRIPAKCWFKHKRQLARTLIRTDFRDFGDQLLLCFGHEILRYYANLYILHVVPRHKVYEKYGYITSVTVFSITVLEGETKWQKDL